MLNFIQNIDIFIIKQFYNFQHSLNSKLLSSILIFFTNLGNHGLIWITVTLFLLSIKKYRKIGYLAIISLIINAIIVNVILKNRKKVWKMGDLEIKLVDLLIFREDGKCL